MAAATPLSLECHRKGIILDFKDTHTSYEKKLMGLYISFEEIPVLLFVVVLVGFLFSTFHDFQR